MKKWLVFIVLSIFLLTSLPLYAKDKRSFKRDDRGNKYYEQGMRDERYRRGPERKDRRYHKRNYRRPHYRGAWDRYSHPSYKGHFRSHHQWKRYYHKHRHNYRNERYYRGNDNFMRFSFCERDSGMCFSFSIQE